MNIIIPRFTGNAAKKTEFMKELHWGKFVNEYFAFEKIEYLKRTRGITDKYKNHEQSNKSEMRLDAVIDPRMYFRWLAEDPNFWKDQKNVDKFCKQNPELRPWKT